MTVTLTATADPEAGAVALVLDAGGVGTLDALTRTDANGRTDVRLPVLPETFEVLALSDHESAVLGPISYEAAVTVAGVQSRVEVYVPGIDLPPRSWLLHPAVTPENLTRITFVDWKMTRASGSTVTAVIGRADPVVNRAPLALRAGTLEIACDSYEEVQALAVVAESAETLMLRQNVFANLDGYFEVSGFAPSIDMEHVRPGFVPWRVALTLTEVRRPSGPLLAPASWTYGDVLAGYPTYRAVRDAFPTYRELLLDLPEVAA